LLKIVSKSQFSVFGKKEICKALFLYLYETNGGFSQGAATVEM